MSPNQITSNMVIALIEQRFVCSPAEVSEAYKEIYKAVTNPNA